jgi:hypothetical protein
MLALRSGGVGSFDESLSEALLTGRSIIQIDNVRGPIRSQFLEALLTCPTNATVPARVPHRGEVHINPAGLIFQLTSNGFTSTRDLSNRSCIIRIRKRQGFSFRRFKEGDLLEHVRANQPRFLAAMHCIVSEWMRRGRPRTDDLRGEGRFREWFRVLDWIVQKICNLPPILDGHQQAQEQASNPVMDWLRQIAPLLEENGRLGQTVTAGDLAQLSLGSELSIPGLMAASSDAQRKMKVGLALGQLFKQDDCIEVDAFTMRRVETKEPRADGDGYIPGKGYVLSKRRKGA